MFCDERWDFNAWVDKHINKIRTDCIEIVYDIYSYSGTAESYIFASSICASSRHMCYFCSTFKKSVTV